MRVVQGRGGHRVPFDIVTVVLHWTTVALIVFQAATGLSLQFAEARLPAKMLLDLHRSLGAAVWVVILLRLIWRLSFERYPAFPRGMSALQQFLARHTEHLLYVLLLVQPATGLAMSFMQARPLHIFLWTVPAVSWANSSFLACLQVAHLIGGYTLFVIVGGHAGMALFHHYILKDDVLGKMAPWVKQRRARPLCETMLETLSQ